MDTDTIIIIGGGIMQIPVIKQAKSMGLRVYLVDGNPHCPGTEYADVFVWGDISDEETVFREVEKTVLEKISAVLTVGTDYSQTVSRLGEYFGVPVLPYRCTPFLTDKSLMREKLTSAGLPQPDFCTVRNENEFRDAINYLAEKKKPVVIKPVDSMGARGVKQIDLMDGKRRKDYFSQFLPYFIKAMGYSRKKKVILEEMIVGKEFSIDALAHDGEIQVTGVADRVIEFTPCFVETGHVIPSQASEGIIHQLIKKFTETIRIITDHQSVSGAFKGDVFFTEDGRVMVGEIAGRLSGGYMSGYTYPLSSGVNLMEAVIKISLGRSPFPLKEVPLGVVIEKAVFGKPGRVVAIKGEDEVRECPGVKEVFFHVKEGDAVFRPENNLMKCANLIVRGQDYLQAEKYLHHALQVLQVITR